VVSYRGVHVEVPAAWPVVDGMHAGLCGSPFPAAPVVFTGPDDNPAPDCPAPRPDLPARDGAWLAPGAPTPDARRAAGRNEPPRDRPGSPARPDPDPHLIQVWYRHVAIEIGAGPDPQVARRILGSVGYTRGTPDTPSAGHCARAGGPARMPAPVRLTRRMVIDHGDITLNPPLPSSRPVMPAAAAWRQARITSPFDRYRLLLARYSDRFPARPGPGGTLVPLDRDVLAWVIYSQPRTPIPGCGLWGLTPFNALTSQPASSDSWSPGP
jgi:hypothetical protein